MFTVIRLNHSRHSVMPPNKSLSVTILTVLTVAKMMRHAQISHCKRQGIPIPKVCLLFLCHVTSQLPIQPGCEIEGTFHRSLSPESIL